MKHTTISIAMTIINVKIISPISHLPSVRIYKKGNTDLGESQDVNVSLELLSVLSGTYVPFFCRQRATLHFHRLMCQILGCALGVQCGRCTPPEYLLLL